ncbi:MAG TPA: helix-hairpin-helix domain-containing protein, partial [Pyrinomonadaceae bacterium]|nr:helix-hairpin-helix domain-containing protein [Pyrinomonadaceae bacterium]
VDPVGACVGMKGSRVQAIIRELRGEKIDIIEWSDEPSVFAANALSPAKVNQVRITDIENRQMEVIVNEDQLSLAIGKRGQNVRLATKLVGWNIDIRSEDEIKREIAEQMGATIASGGTVPLSAIHGITAATSAALAEHGIDDVDALAAATIDELSEYLDTSIDEAQAILDSAKAVVAARDAKKQDPTADDAAATGEEAEVTDVTEQHAVSAEYSPDIDAGEVEPSDAMIAAGYDEAVERGVPFRAEADILGRDSADPVATTEVESMSDAELSLQGANRDLRPDTITPSPDVTSAGAAVLDHLSPEGDDAPPVEDDSPLSPTGDFASEGSAPETAHEAGSVMRTPEQNVDEDAEGEKRDDASTNSAG